MLELFSPLKLELIIFAILFFYLFFNKSIESWLNHGVSIWSEVFTVSTTVIIGSLIYFSIFDVGPEKMRLLGYEDYELYLLASGFILTFFYEGGLVYMGMLGLLVYKLVALPSISTNDYLLVFSISVSCFNLRNATGISKIMLREISKIYLIVSTIFLISCSVYTMGQFDNFYLYTLEKIGANFWQPSMAIMCVVGLAFFSALLSLGQVGRTAVFIISIPSYLVLSFIFPHQIYIAPLILGGQIGFLINPHLFKRDELSLSIMKRVASS